MQGALSKSGNDLINGDKCYGVEPPNDTQSRSLGDDHRKSSYFCKSELSTITSNSYKNNISNNCNGCGITPTTAVTAVRIISATTVTAVRITPATTPTTSTVTPATTGTTPAITATTQATTATTQATTATTQATTATTQATTATTQATTATTPVALTDIDHTIRGLLTLVNCNPLKDHSNQSNPKVTLSQTTPNRVTLSKTTPTRITLLKTTPTRITLLNTTPTRVSLSNTTPTRITLSNTTPTRVTLTFTSHHHCPEDDHQGEGGGDPQQNVLVLSSKQNKHRQKLFIPSKFQNMDGSQNKDFSNI
ncbi:hypothetical protein FHG87_020834 [Trinorchestia longiramus]|nr:hypothetical protein FHG87_020834 [Trinorchestia longiramus]